MKKRILYIFLIAVIVALAFFLVENTRKIQGKAVSVTGSNLGNSVSTEISSTESLPKNPTRNYFPRIFAFHNVTTDFKKDPYGLTINNIEFEKKLKDLVDHKYKMIFVSDIAAYLEKGERVPDDELALTFDDGKENFYTNVFPLLKKYNIKASLYIITGVRSKNFLNSEQIKEIDQSGLVEIGSHTVYHQFLSKLSDEDQMKELKNSKKYLEDLLGKEITTICYPYGDHNDKTKEFAKQVGYKYGLNFDNTKLHDPSDLFEIDRLGVYPTMNIVSFLEELNKKK